MTNSKMTSFEAPELPKARDTLEGRKAKLWLGLSACVLFCVTAYNVQAALTSVEAYKVDVALLQSEATKSDAQRSLDEMQKVIAQRTALQEIQSRLNEVEAGGRNMSEAEARRLLVKAGFNPEEVLQSRQKSAEDLAKQDFEFMKAIANDIVRDELQSYAEKANILTKVGTYVMHRSE